MLNWIEVTEDVCIEEGMLIKTDHGDISIVGTFEPQCSSFRHGQFEIKTNGCECCSSECKITHYIPTTLEDILALVERYWEPQSVPNSSGG